MVTMSLGDPNLIENVRALNELKKSGLFSDEELQEMYDRQVKKDKEQKEGNA